MARLGTHTASLVALVMMSACAVGYPRQLDLIENDPLADTDLLGLSLISASEGQGMRGWEAAYVSRSFETPGQRSLRVVSQVKEVGENSGWLAEYCVGKPRPGGEELDYLMYMTKRNEGLVASVTVNQSHVGISITGAGPEGTISLLSQPGEPDC